jgi:hypothetical protein
MQNNSPKAGFIAALAVVVAAATPVQAVAADKTAPIAFYTGKTAPTAVDTGKIVYTDKQFQQQLDTSLANVVTFQDTGKGRKDCVLAVNFINTALSLTNTSTATQSVLAQTAQDSLKKATESVGVNGTYPCTPQPRPQAKPALQLKK